MPTGRLPRVFVDCAGLAMNIHIFLQAEVQWLRGRSEFDILSDVSSKDAIIPIKEKDTAGKDYLTSTYNYDNVQ